MRFLVKLAYKPLQIAFAVVATKAARRTFSAAWARFDDGEPPTPTTEDATWPKVVGAAALRAATSASSRAIADRASARTFRYLFGIWPGR